MKNNWKHCADNDKSGNDMSFKFNFLWKTLDEFKFVLR